MDAHFLVIMSSPFCPSLCVVHGFKKVSYDVIEDSNLATTFSLNVKGTTALLGAVTGEVTSQPGTARGKLLVHTL